MTGARLYISSEQVTLLAHLICFREPSFNVFIYLDDVLEPKGMQVISGRKRFDAAEARIFQPAGQHDMAIDPVLSDDERGKTHPHLKRDPCLFREHNDGPVFPRDPQHLLEDRADERRLSLKVGGKGGATASVRLIPIGKLAAAVRASPHGGWIVRSAARCFTSRLRRHF
jgi:hypothetical protein